MNLHRLATLVGCAMGFAAVATQFVLVMERDLAAGAQLVPALVHFFSFYTILSNLALALVYLSDLSRASWLGFFRSPLTRGTMLAAILLVMIFYHILLASLWTPQGLFKLTDVTLHYVAPLLYSAWWLFLQPHGGLRWAHVPIMLLPTLVYFFYILVRGAIVTDYPYPILDVAQLGYVQVFINALIVAIGLAFLCAVVVAADRLAARVQPQSSRDLA